MIKNEIIFKLRQSEPAMAEYLKAVEKLRALGIDHAARIEIDNILSSIPSAVQDETKASYLLGFNNGFNQALHFLFNAFSNLPGNGETERKPTFGASEILSKKELI